MKTIVAEVCIKKDDKILMVQENRKEKKGKWNMPAGKLEDNEDILEAAKREVKEETNLNVDIKGLIGLEENVSSMGQLIILYFLGEYKSGNIKFNKDEIAKVSWLSVEEINGLGIDNIRGGKTINKIIELSDNNVFDLERIMIENDL